MLTGLVGLVQPAARAADTIEAAGITVPTSWESIDYSQPYCPGNGRQIRYASYPLNDDQGAQVTGRDVEDPNVVHLDIPAVTDAQDKTKSMAGIRGFVILPSDYTTTTKRYPVVYLLHGGGSLPDEYLQCMDTIKFLAAFHAAHTDLPEPIVVLPGSPTRCTQADIDAGQQVCNGGISVADAPIAQGLKAGDIRAEDSEYSNWVHDADGKHQFETLHTQVLIDYVDTHFRTYRDRAHRAIAGLSLGGFGVMHYAGKHPDLYVAAAGFSSAPTFAEPDPASEFAAGQFVGYRQWGDATSEKIYQRNANPPEYAMNFRGVSVWNSANTATPCTAQDMVRSAQGTLVNFEVQGQEYHFPEAFFVTRGNLTFKHSLDEAGVSETLVQFPCGTHDYQYFQRGLHLGWEPLVRAFGNPAPTVADYKTADPRFAVWGWNFAVPRPTSQLGAADEFMTIRGLPTVPPDAPTTFTVTGSGTVTATTPPWYGARQKVRIAGAGCPDSSVCGDERIVQADGRGRIAFHVYLGEAHQVRQYLPCNAASENAPGYFTTKAVTLSKYTGPKPDDVQPAARFDTNGPTPVPAACNQVMATYDDTNLVETIGVETLGF